ncbi:arf-GAP with dual PH domain-containing protein 1-like [Trichogramma pretiosum]|uniref:arf-GAP with dual PH domain-containing protein 1-like n=1 Tax=Trichogramma pretiosum TaxID=7493 RepID=UPI0006C974C1|nr:arf-GAP with dual PH domain-containing protein 1-like [Trichogramma pretiosum]
MADPNEKLIADLLKKPGNNICADCGAKNPEWASYNIGIFICTKCAGVHRSMGTHISKVKHITLDKWEDSQVSRVREVGNVASKLHFEERVPSCYRKPNQDSPDVLIEQWIRAKYEREEFCHPERQSHYVSGFMEGFLMKRGKEDPKYQPRKFVLNEADDTLKYYVKENKEPKAVLRISELNVSFAPAKTGNQNSLQISFLKDGTTRHIYVYHDESEVITNWYLAIRCAKLHRLQVAYPGANEQDLLSQLTKDFPKEGFLWKTGPRPSDTYKKRWFTLDGRKLMYHEDPMDANPKGEIFLGHTSEGYAIKMGVPPGARDQGYSFTLQTPDRTYLLSAQANEDRIQWMQVLQKVIDRPLTPQDASIAARLVRKRNPDNVKSCYGCAKD